MRRSRRAAATGPGLRVNRTVQRRALRPTSNLVPPFSVTWSLGWASAEIRAARRTPNRPLLLTASHAAGALEVGC